MSLPPHTRIGPYEVVEAIGAGGMGEVYRARDHRLNRDVAIKVLPALFANDPERMARFQREAQVLASLNHPNIAALYGLEEAGSTRALVMELVEGPTLGERIASGAIPLEESLDIARQMAEAMEYAHDRSVVHRDLKPGNVKITPHGSVKILDFGLAKALDDLPVSGGSSQNSPTLTMNATRAGVILGTAAYMSPEQAKGKPVDRRADIWSYGVVVCEMLTGKQLYTGETAAETMASVMKEAPKLERLPADTPRSIRNMIARCLEKDPRQRLRDIGEARLMLEGRTADEPVLASRSTRPVTWMVAVAALVVALAALAFFHFRETPAAERGFRLSVALPPNSAVGHFALSPDGRTLVMNIYGDGKTQLWLRSLDSPELRPLPGAENARVPFWSPDSRYLGFFAQGKLKIISANGGPAQTLCDAGFNGGGAWNRDGVILFGADSGPLQEVNAAGGACTAVTKAEGNSHHMIPVFLPDGRHFLYTVDGGEEAKQGVYVAALDDPNGRRLLADHSSAIFVPPTSGDKHGYLMFLRESTLMAQPFDSGTLQLAGDTFAVAGQASFSYSIPQVAAAVENGILVYLANSATSARDFQLTWVDRSGKELEKVGPRTEMSRLSLSPNEKTIAITRLGLQSGLWLRDMVRNVETRFTFPPLVGSAPVWSPDGSRIAFSSGGNLYLKDASSSGPEQLIFQSENPKLPSDWSPDGRSLIYTEIDAKTGADLWILPIPSSTPADEKPVKFLVTEFVETQGQISPDGRWLAYVSDEGGQYEVYVRSFPSGAGKTKVSINRSYEPRWSKDGKELFYMEGTPPRFKMIAVPVKGGSSAGFEAGASKQLFEFRTLPNNVQFSVFDYGVTKDGRFLINVQSDSADPTLNVITNWRKALGEKLP